MRDWHVRPATLNDLDAVSFLFDQYRQFYSQPPDPAGAKLFVEERMMLRESILYLAVRNSGEALGFAQLYPTFSSVTMQRSLILNDLFVMGDARKSGVGQALLDAAHEYAKRTRAKGLFLQTAKDNVPAQTLYEQYGFERDTVFVSYFLPVTSKEG